MTARLLRRALAVWLLLMALETTHGILRRLLLVPAVGDLPARQIGVGVGSLLILLVAVATAPWLQVRTRQQQATTGVLWAVLTLGFEVALGLATGASWARIRSDYDLTHGGLMPLGLVVLALAPAIGTRLRGVPRV